VDLDGQHAEPAARASRMHGLQADARPEPAAEPVRNKDTYEQLNAVPASARNTTDEERDRARGQERISTPPFGLAAVENEPTRTSRRPPLAPPAEPEEVFSSEVEAIGSGEAPAALPEGTQPSGELPPIGVPDGETGTAKRPRGDGEARSSAEAQASGTDLRPRPRNRALSAVILVLLVVVGAIGVALALKRQGLLPSRHPSAEPSLEQPAAPPAAEVPAPTVVGSTAAEEPDIDEGDAAVEADEPDGGGVVVEEEGAVVVSPAAKEAAPTPTPAPAAPAVPVKKKPVKKHKHR
jgi:hypothetical protein